MRIARIYRYQKVGIASSVWERWTLFLLKILAGLSVVFFDFALLLLVAKDRATDPPRLSFPAIVIISVGAKFPTRPADSQGLLIFLFGTYWRDCEFM